MPDTRGMDPTLGETVMRIPTPQKARNTCRRNYSQIIKGEGGYSWKTQLNCTFALFNLSAEIIPQPLRGVSKG